MNPTAPPLELHGIVKLREEELQEARCIQAVMLPAESLRTALVTISHGFQPVSAVGGDFLDYFELLDGTIGLYLCDVFWKRVARRAVRCEVYTRPARRRAMRLPPSTGA